jgi:hypothetical protein
MQNMWRTMMDNANVVKIKFSIIMVDEKSIYRFLGLDFTHHRSTMSHRDSSWDDVPHRGTM